MSVPWIEKYRPRSIDDIASQSHTVAVLRKTLQAKLIHGAAGPAANLPHMLFYGPPGTGKTSTILALARQLYGPELMRSRVLELNASDERGISVVRDKIKSFAKETPRAGPSNSAYPCPPYKIVILDEADSMTQDAQAALRRLMETYARVTRFCIICNYVTRIIEPLVSRCSKFRFKPLDRQSAAARLNHIAQEESVTISPATVDTLLNAADGDLRRAITYLQSAAKLSGHGSATRKPLQKDENGDLNLSNDDATSVIIAPDSIDDIAGLVPVSVIESLCRACSIDADGVITTDQNSGLELVRAKVKNIIRSGFSAYQLLTQLHDHLIAHVALTSKHKSFIALALAETDKSLTEGADEELQLLSMALKIKKAAKE